MVDAKGVYDSIEKALSRFGILKFEARIVGLDVDGASVNMGQYTVL